MMGGYCCAGWCAKESGFFSRDAVGEILRLCFRYRNIGDMPGAV